MSYRGSCHCGTVKFTFTLPEPIEEQEVVQCNCSICIKNGYLMVYPKESDTTFDHPQDAVKAYYFAKKIIPHYFCVNCGSSVYAKRPGANSLMAINVRTVEGVDLGKLRLRHIDRRSV